MQTKILFLFSILIFASNSFSQNWKLLDENKTYFYKHIDSLYITNTIKIDSTNNSATDSIFNIHTTIKVCDTCTNIPPEAIGGVLYHVHYPEIFGYTPFYSVTNNHHNFDGNIIQQNSQLSDSWIFNTNSGVTATIVDTDEINILGNLDSIKVIELSTLDTIIISKNNGVIRFPDFDNTGKYYSLTGYHEGQNSFGEYLPNMWRIYDFNVGDIFSYYLDRTDDCDSYGQNITWTVLEDLSNADSVSYRIKILGVAFNYFNDCFPGHPLSFYTTQNKIDTFSLAYDVHMLENQYSGIAAATLNSPDDYTNAFYNPPFRSPNFFTDVLSVFPLDDINLLHHKMGGYYISNEYLKYDHAYKKTSDSLCYKLDELVMTNLDGYNYIVATYFMPSLGRVQGWFEMNTFFSCDQLQGYVKNGDTVGTIYNFPDDLGFENTYSEKLFIFPNPANSQIYIPVDLHMISIYSATGDLVLQLENPTHQMYVGDLPAGIYFVHGFDLEGNRMETKLVVSD